MISKFNGTSTPKWSYSAKTDVNYPMSLTESTRRMLWSNGCKVQGKISSHILKKNRNGRMVKAYKPQEVVIGNDVIR